MKSILHSIRILLIIITIAFISCENKDEVTPPALKENELAEAPKAKATEFRVNYANLAQAGYGDALKGAEALKEKLNALSANPTTETLEAAKTEWKKAREAYGPTEVFRFHQGPIDTIDGVEGRMNAWPLDELYIDNLTSDQSQFKGIIQNTADFPTISAAVLAEQNEKDGEANISIGYHAIEYLLWGQDDQDTSLKTPGQRKVDVFKDAVVGERRLQYLNATVDQLIEDLKLLTAAWDSNGSGNFYNSFLAGDINVQTKQILRGLSVFGEGELRGERMAVALTNKSQEDEHSCFSDNTHRDIILNIVGIQNIIEGKWNPVYGGSVITGTSLLDIISTVDEKVAADLKAKSAASITLAEAIPFPFDHALVTEAPSGGPIRSAITSLEEQAKLVVEGASKLNLTIAASQLTLDSFD